MESRKQDHHKSVPAVETPVLFNSSLPANIIQLSSSALFPLGPTADFGSVLSLPLVSNPFVSPVCEKQQLPMQNETLLLLPASALSLSSPSLSPTIQSTSVLYNHQLHLNSFQLPLVLKQSATSGQANQSFNAQHMSQQLIILPAEGGILDQNADSKINSNHKNLLVNASHSGRKNVLHFEQETNHSQKEKWGSPKTKLKVINVKSKDISTTKPESSVLSTSDYELNKLDMAQIISSIPPGWQVVGFTGLNQMVLEDILPSSRPSSSLPSLFTGMPKTSSTEENSDIKREVDLLTEEITPLDQPSLVSVNLNTTLQPFASETVFDKWPANELTCSVKMDDIPCTHVISIKRECMESNEDNTETTSNGSDLEHLSNGHQEPSKTIDSHVDSCATKVEQNIYSQESDRNADVESCDTSENDFSLQESIKTKLSGSDSSITQPILADSKWTIIGITSLPPLPSTNTITTSQVDMTTSRLALNREETSDVDKDISCASNTTILKVPFCPPAVSSAKNKKNTLISNTIDLHKAVKCSPVSLVLNDGNQSSSDVELSVNTRPEDIKWTVVGVMGSPLTSPCISSGSEFINNSYPVTSSPLSSVRLDNVVNNQLLGILSPLVGMDSNPLLFSAGSPPDQLSPNTQEKRKSQEAVKKFPKSRTATNNYCPKQNNYSSQSENQWKVVGVTHLGIPPTAVSPVVPLSQVNPVPRALLIPTASAPFFSNLTSETASKVTQTASITPSSSLLSSLSPSLYSPPALPFPILNFDGTPCSSSLTLSSLLGAESSASIQTLQDLAQQQNLNHFMQNQLTVCQNPINMLTLNETNHWNVVGVVANNQVSLLNQNQGYPSVANTMTTDSKLSNQCSVPHTISVAPVENIKSTEKLSITEGRRRIKGATVNKSVTIKQSLASRHDDSDHNCCNFKCKDMVNKNQQESTKIKKNTVSNLLRMKRMQQKTGENGSSDDEDQSFEDYQDISDVSYEVPQKKLKTRSLRSYAGNRKIFTRMQNKAIDEKVSLRSGTQIPVVSSKLEDDEDAAHLLPANSKNMVERVTDALVPVKEPKYEDKIIFDKINTYSSSRRRKLKVPRKLIADLDYHPFDSSSDSN